MSDQEFLEFWKNIKWQPVIPVYFRLYYDERGYALFYSHENLPGKYIDITAEQFAIQDLQVRVIGGVLHSRTQLTAPKLVPSKIGTACDPTDVSIVVDQQQHNQRWKLHQYESN